MFEALCVWAMPWFLQLQLWLLTSDTDNVFVGVPLVNTLEAGAGTQQRAVIFRILCLGICDKALWGVCSVDSSEQWTCHITGRIFTLTTGGIYVWIIHQKKMVMVRNFNIKFNIRIITKLVVSEHNLMVLSGDLHKPSSSIERHTQQYVVLLLLEIVSASIIWQTKKHTRKCFNSQIEVLDTKVAFIMSICCRSHYVLGSFRHIYQQWTQTYQNICDQCSLLDLFLTTFLRFSFQWAVKKSLLTDISGQIWKP